MIIWAETAELRDHIQYEQSTVHFSVLQSTKNVVAFADRMEFSFFRMDRGPARLSFVKWGRMEAAKSSRKIFYSACFVGTPRVGPWICDQL